MDLDAHVINHADDVFDLFGFDYAFGQMVVHLGVSQKALIFAFRNEFFKTGLLIFIHNASSERECQSNRVVYKTYLGFSKVSTVLYLLCE